MVLLIKDECPACETVRHLVKTVLKVIQWPDGGLFINVGSKNLVPLPEEIKALPALIISKGEKNHIYIGEGPIKQALGVVHGSN